MDVAPVSNGRKSRGGVLQHGRTYQPVDTTEHQEPAVSTGHASSPDNNGDCNKQTLSSECSNILGEEGRSSKTFSLCKISRDKKILLLMMAVCNFCAAANFSLLGPFFPEEVTSNLYSFINKFSIVFFQTWSINGFSNYQGR